MKGTTNIKLYDMDGNIVSEQNDDNFVTDLFDNLIKSFDIIFSSNSFTRGEPLKNIIGNNKKLIDFIGGVVLFNKHLPEDTSTVHADVFSVASAGSTYDLSDPLRGTLNTLESGSTIVNGKQGYRWVWDFGTSNANSPINCVGLTLKNAGDRFSGHRTDNTLKDIGRFGGGDSLSTQFGYVYDKKGREFRVDNNGNILMSQYNTSARIDKDHNSIVVQTVPTTGFSLKSKKGLILVDNTLMCVAESITTTNLHLLKIDLDTLAITSNEELTGLEVALGDKNVLCYGLCGSNTLVIYKGYKDRKRRFVTYDLNTKTVINPDLLVTVRYEKDTTDGLYAITSKRANGENYMCDFTLSQSYGDYGHHHICFLNKDQYKVGCEKVDAEFCYHPVHNINGSLLNFGHHLRYSNSRFGEISYALGGVEPLFTINNLANQVDKTDTNTMKVSYTLTWD